MSLCLSGVVEEDAVPYDVRFAFCEVAPATCADERLAVADGGR